MSLLVNFVMLIGSLAVVFGAEISTQATSANCWNAITPGSDFFHPLSSGFVRSRHGYLDTRLHYKQSAGDKGSYCYLLEDSEIRSPTLRAFPGDNMLVTLSNELNLKTEKIFALPTNNYCTIKVATFSSTNMHFHGIHSPPFCHDDNVVMSVIPTGKSFTYNVEIPISQPPGLYWYHPHMHEVAYNQVTGGASGLIVIEGIQKIQPLVAGKREQVIAIRDYNSTSINFIAVNSTNAVPMRVVPNDLQFWRIGNIGADQQRNLTYSWGGQIRPFQIIAIDGVTVGDGLSVSTVEVTHYLLTTGGRVEILLRTPPLNFNGVLSDHNVAGGSKFYSILHSWL
jgi:FtsP/CotA-like multicopper oxidase with cupredoxin domain